MRAKSPGRRGECAVMADADDRYSYPLLNTPCVSSASSAGLMMLGRRADDRFGQGGRGADERCSAEQSWAWTGP
jgi:hypothetical protein